MLFFFFYLKKIGTPLDQVFCTTIFGKCRAVILRHVRDLDRDAARDLFVGPGDVAIRVGHYRRIAGIRLLADANVQRQAAQNSTL